MPPVPPRNGAGELSLLLGVVAVVFAFFPIIGEFIAAPAAVLAVVLGYVGIGRVERGLASNQVGAWLGTGLGLLAAFIIVLVLAASSDLGG